MNRTVAAIVEQAGVYAASFDRVTAGRGIGDGSSALPIRLASDRELLDGLERVSLLTRLAEAERVRIAGEVARRSPVGDPDSLARRMGATSGAALVAERALLSRTAAADLIAVGEALRPRESLSGESMIPDHPHLLTAVQDGVVSVPVARAILRVLTKVECVLPATRLLELERHLIGAVVDGWGVDRILAYLKRVPGMLDADKAPDRDRKLEQLAKVLEISLESGLTRFILDLDPVTAGLFKTAMDAGATLNRTGLFLDGDPDPDGPADAISEAETVAEQADRRPLKRRRVDGVRLMATRALRMDDGDTGGTAVTMLVTISEESLRTRIGSACIDGIEQDISAATARMLAASATLIPVVLAGQSRPVDVGDGRRFFSTAQRHAMAARDGGCAGPGCSMPASACDAAHIRPAGWGPTAVDNGVLLCWHCHKLLDLHGWQIRRHNGRWWWTPPPWVDVLARPRPGGRIIPPPAFAA